MLLVLVLIHCPHALWSCSMARVHSHPPPEHSLSRCSETAGRVKKGLGFGCFDRLAYKKSQTPKPCSSLGCRLVHHRSGGFASDCSFAFGSAHSSFLFNGSLICRKGRGTGVSPREDNHAVLVSLRLPIPEAISSLGCHAGGVAARTARAGFGVIL